MLKSRGNRVGKSDPLDDIIRSIIKHVSTFLLITKPSIYLRLII